jgi:ATP-dependent Clp protease, protease subunit
MALFLLPALHSALLVPSSGLLRSSSSALSMQSLNAGSAYSSLIRADEPEIDPRRKDPPGPSPPGRFVPLPTVGAGDDKMDVMSRLLKDRILLLGSQVDDEVGNVLVAQLLYLANENAQKDITLYINSPGGSVSAQPEPQPQPQPQPLAPNPNPNANPNPNLNPEA